MQLKMPNAKTEDSRNFFLSENFTENKSESH